MKKRFFLAFLLACIFYPYIIAAQSIDSRFENAEVLKQGFSGLLVKDLETREIIYQRLPEKYFTPASNIKLLTFYTGLKLLPDSVPALRYWANNDVFIFSGTGDPSFLNPELPESPVFEFLKNRTEKLQYLPSINAESHYGPGWAWDDYNSSYSPERAEFPIYGNLARFSPVYSRRAPAVSPRIFQDSIVVRNFQGQRTGIQRDLNRNLFTYYYVPALPKQPETKLPFRYTPQLMVELLKDTLQRNVEIIKDLPRTSGAPTTLYSIPTDSLYKKMLQDSDNFIAEQILLMSSQQLAGSSNANLSINHIKRSFLRDLPDEIHWVDGSGLSRYNLITPRSMVSLLEKIYKEVEQERLFHLLATGGESGTIKYYYWAPQPYIFAKTGTLLHNHSMSGYLRTRSGRIFAFSFMNSNHMVPTREIRKEMEIILRQIYRDY